jgi:hypothetical protein
MRTTLDLDDRLHAAVRRIAFEERRSLGDVVSDLALRGLAVGPEGQSRALRRPLDVFAGLIHVADDFNTTPAEVESSLEQPLR